MVTNLNRVFKEQIYEQFARIGKALAAPKRIELLELICHGERSVDILAKETGITVANASQHLQILKTAHLVETEKNGLFVTYRIADESVVSFLRTIRLLAKKQLSEVEQITHNFFKDKAAIELVDRKLLFKKLRAGLVIVLDVRPLEEYRAGHIPHAISIPLKELKHRLSELPHNREIVAYCRGPYCVLAVQAVEILRKKGFKAKRLEDGIPDWQAYGLPVVREAKR